jgi:hypothetical protein
LFHIDDWTAYLSGLSLKGRAKRKWAPIGGDATRPRRPGPPGERRAAGPHVPDVIAEEQRLSHAFGGRSVFGYEPAPAARDRDQKTRARSNRG